MSERERGERADEQAAREQVDERAVEADVEREDDDDEAREAEAKRRAPIGPWLSRSPASTLAMALSMADVDLVAQLAPHAVHAEWRFDGRFTLELTAPVVLEVGERALRFEAAVTGRASHDGLTELEGVTLVAEDGGAVERICGGEADGALAVYTIAAARPVKVPAPAH